jgi:hypothetical protein
VCEEQHRKGFVKNLWKLYWAARRRLEFWKALEDLGFIWQGLGHYPGNLAVKWSDMMKVLSYIGQAL